MLTTGASWLAIGAALTGFWSLDWLFKSERHAGNGYRLVKISAPNSPVWVGITEVSFGEYLAFVRETGTSKQKKAFEKLAKRAPIRKHPQSGIEREPIVMVSLWDSFRFAKWLTQKDREARNIRENEEYTLPSDLEWSQALRESGEMYYPNHFQDEGSTARYRNNRSGVFLWGSDDLDTKAATGNLLREADGFPVKKGNKLVNGDSTLYLAAVDTAWPGVQSEHIFNMVGNVREWCRDDANSSDGNTPPPKKAKRAVLRGGSYRTYKLEQLRAGHRDFVPPEQRAPDIGFRLVLRKIP